MGLLTIDRLEHTHKSFTPQESKCMGEAQLERVINLCAILDIGFAVDVDPETFLLVDSPEQTWPNSEHFFP